MNFTPINFINNLVYIVKGELGLFFALGIIALYVCVDKVASYKTVFYDRDVFSGNPFCVKQS